MFKRLIPNILRNLLVSTDELPIVLVFGAPRTGTNYLEELILRNFFCRVANLNRELSRSLKGNRTRPWLYDKIGSKHSIRALKNFDRFAHSMKSVVIFRPPQSWINARARYHLTYINPNENNLSDLITQWVQSEFNTFYSATENHPIVNYENLVKKPKIVCSLLADLDIKARSHFAFLNKEVLPGGQVSEAPPIFTKPDIFSKDEFNNDISPLFDQGLVKRLNERGEQQLRELINVQSGDLGNQ